MIDVLVGKFESGLGERVEIYLRTVHGRRVVSFETVVGGEPSNQPGIQVQCCRSREATAAYWHRSLPS